MRRRTAGFAIGTALAVALAGCSEITGFPAGGVEVRAAHALPAVTTSEIDFTANVAVDNFTGRTIFVDPDCHWVIERFTGEDWIEAYTASCAGPIAPIVEIAPHSTRIFTVAALAVRRIENAAFPPGTYRIRLLMEASYSQMRLQPIPEDQRVSNPFAVVLP